MNRAQWLNHLRTIDRMREKGLLDERGALKCIDTLIDSERKEWDEIEMENAGLVKKRVALSKKKDDNI